MLLFTTALKMWAEIALMTLAAQALLALLAGQSRARNPIYQVLQWLTQPLLAPLRRLMPAAAEPRLRWLLAAALGLVWLISTGLKLQYCLSVGVSQCL
ncbi:YggT family protein [Paucibacter sp. B2R-40]|uniref:YggT family protein n=1 Tax=Paucibacter sp. B2R-40 TaxID=2893554 RepID=UPI0021E4A1C0|nr:YggT family protein [Paucibacter sp. B2R-40]MCV2355099.1 YggT family protein [Paucibacter sp. B2R-40]